MVQKNADIAEAKKAAAAIAQIANRYCAPEEGNSAGFPQFNAQVSLYLLQQRQIHRCCLHLQLEVRRDSRSRKAKGRTMRKEASQNLPKVESQNLQKVASQNSRKVVSQNLRKGGKDEKGGKDDKGGKNVAKGEFKGEFKGKEGDKGKQGSKRAHTACSQSFWFEVCTHLRRTCGGC